MFLSLCQRLPAFLRLWGRVWVLSLWLGVQLPAASAQAHNYSFPFEHLTIDQGLSHTTVHSILEDRQGFIWIGTRFGLNRFDGYDFEVFLPQAGAAGALSGHEVFCLMEDHRGNIWVGHQEKGISIYHPEQERFSPFPAEKFPNIDWETLSVRSLYQDQKGNIWIGTYGAGVLVLDRDLTPLMQLCSYCEAENHPLHLANDFVFDFEEDAQGKIWMGIGGQGIAVYDPDREEVRHLSGRVGDQIEGFGRELCMDQKGYLWVGTPGFGLYKVDVGAEKVVQKIEASGSNGLSHNMITDIERDRQGQLWMATDGGGLNRYEEASGAWEQFHYSAQHPGTLNTDALYELMRDRHDNLWVGTFNGGLNLHRADQSPFASNRAYLQERLSGLRSVLALAQDAEGEVWMGTDGAGLFRGRMQGPVIQVEPLNPRVQGDFPQVVTSIAPTPSGDLWLGTYGEGLFRIDPTRGIVEHFLHEAGEAGSLSHNNVWDLALDASGGLWVGTLGGGLTYLPAGAKTFISLADMLPAQGPSLSGVQVLDILLDKKGERLWVATENAGLNGVHTQTLEVVQYHPTRDSNSLSSERLRCLYEDRDGTLWIGTEYAGLNRLDPETGTILRYDQRHGLPSDMINGILRGPDGYLWVSTQAGITRWDPSTSTSLLLGADPYVENNQLNPDASLALPDGRLLFGSTNGYTLVQPDQVRTHNRLPSVLFSAFFLSNEPISVRPQGDESPLTTPLNAPGTVVHLSYEDRGIQFRLTTDHAAQAPQQTYEYRLRNYETQWHRLRPGRRTVTFAGLPGGTHLLEVRVVGAEGESGPTRQLILAVEPPFWETGWFLGLCILIGLLILSGIIAYLLQQQKAFYVAQAMQKEREILRLRNENLEKDIEHERSRLSASLLQTAHKNKLLNDLKARMSDLSETAKLDRGIKKIVREINRELKQEDYWQQFQLVFDRTHTEFIDKLQTRYPSLSQHEKRLCCFIRMQLSNREIASILNITVNAVEQAKYRIKKKLQLEKSESLNEHIREI